MNEGKKIRSDAWTHIFFFNSPLFSHSYENRCIFSPAHQKKLNWELKKKTIVPTIVCGFKRIVFLTEIDEEKLNEHKNDVLVLSASKAHTKNIFMVCVCSIMCGGSGWWSKPTTS